MENRRKVVKGSEKETALGSVLLLVILVVCGAILSGSIKAQAASAEPSYKYYTNIQIRTGDTLWDIAGSYMTDDYKDIRTYIEEICTINHISDDTLIRSGQYLTIPYYSKDYLE